MSVYDDGRVSVHLGDCLDVLRDLPDASVDAVVTDPPYGLEFMGKEWDAFRPTTTTNRGGVAPGRSAEQEGRWVAVEYGTAKRRTTLTCDACGKSDKFKKPHGCPEGTEWTRIYLDNSANNAATMRAFQQWCELWTTECLRVLRPGGHLLAFGGTRTWHRLACAVEDAGFEVRDSIAWLYGSGFPKSLDVSKAIDKRGGADIGWFGPWLRQERRRRGISSNQLAKHFPSKTGGETGCVRNWELSLNLPTPEQFNTLCRVLDLPFAEIAEAEREVIGSGKSGAASVAFIRDEAGEYDITAPATPEAERWQGWGTALKPAFEPVVVARKPLSGTVAQTVLQHGTGALNIDGCRVGETVETWPSSRGPNTRNSMAGGIMAQTETGPAPSGRWPTNVVLDDSQAAVLDEMSGELAAGNRPRVRNADENRTAYGAFEGQPDLEHQRLDSGGASRFFPTFRYEAKAPTSERPRVNGTAHPTVKPLDLMRWLVRLVTPPGGTVLEPFAGSGTTVEACIVEGFHCIAIEREADYLPLIMQRVNRRRDPVAYIRAAGDDLGLFELDGEGA